MQPAPPPAIVAAATVSAPAEIGLVGTDGRPFTLGELRGKWVWLYLGFASCPDACPRTLSEVVGTFAGLPKDAPVQPIFVSVDPMRDTPARLEAYVGFYGPRLMGASGPHGALDALTMALGTKYEIPKGAKPDQNYTVAHPDEVFVLDPRGRYVARIDARSPDLPDRLAREFAVPLAAFEARAAAQPAPPPPPSTSAAWCGLPDEAALADPDPLRDPRMHRGATLGSGTSVLPGTTPMRMWAWKNREWLWMAHTNVVGAGYLDGGGRYAFGAENWQKLMGTRYLGPGLADFRVMTSLERWTLPGGGVPQPLQGGMGHEAPNVRTAHHPLTEFAGRYTWTPTSFFSAFAYGGVAGDPALGPGSAMHRPSTADLFGLPLAHHLLEPGHGSHGVATVGARLADVQLEVSRFNGRVPAATRPTLQLGALSSWASRVSWFPGRNVVAQASYGQLAEPHGEGSTGKRATASVLGVFATPIGRWSAGGTWAWADDGMAGGPSQAWGLESQLDVRGRHHFYGRWEWLTGPGWDAIWAPTTTLDVNVNEVLWWREMAFTAGYVYDVASTPILDLGVGGDVMAGYGAGLVRAFVRLRPPTLTHPDDRNYAADGGVSPEPPPLEKPNPQERVKPGEI